MRGGRGRGRGRGRGGGEEEGERTGRDDKRLWSVAARREEEGEGEEREWKRGWVGREGWGGKADDDWSRCSGSGLGYALQQSTLWYRTN